MQQQGRISRCKHGSAQVQQALRSSRLREPFRRYRMLILGSPSLEPFSHLGMLDKASGCDIGFRTTVGLGVRLSIALRKDSLVDLHLPNLSLVSPYCQPAIPAHLTPRRRARDNARFGSNGRQPVRGCSNHTSVAARLSWRTTDGKSHETVHSALWQRAATERTRVPPVRPWGHTPG